MASTFHFLNKRANPALLSIVIPIFNEEDVLPILKAELEKFRKTLPCASEIILVNDGSSDRSLVLLDAWGNEDSSVKVIGFSRNFGHQLAVTAGLDATRGDAIVIMDADLQDPPQVVFEMLARYREGYDVVYGQREEREGESAFKKVTAWAFYRLMKRLVHKDLPLDAGDFRLISRACLSKLVEMRELHRFLRGMIAWAGFAQIGVPYKRSARAAGETKYPLSKMLRFAWTAAVSFSPLPLRAILSLGLVTAFLGFCMGLYAVVRYVTHIIHPQDVTYNPGWATIVTLLCLIGGAILIGIGILGEYLGKVFEEIKQRPLYITSFRKNLD